MAPPRAYGGAFQRQDRRLRCLSRHEVGIAATQDSYKIAFGEGCAALQGIQQPQAHFSRAIFRVGFRESFPAKETYGKREAPFQPVQRLC